ncbi:NucA/NucB deoxyribonuclease domain-containing protein [Undibacterium sp. Tian12W]|uniref:NucA/NucB deoxyribonuclease domain-containing protein n=1 Tax=Undibacterium sp. Tian12W TaxID=3413054 RepID=UPI003BF4376C
MIHHTQYKMLCSAGIDLGSAIQAPAQIRMPIVFMSESQLPGVGQHVYLSQAMASQAILHRTQALRYTNRLVALAKCALGQGMPVTNKGTSCEEYPFASSYEGGIGGTVAKVPPKSNSGQGGVLSAFYRFCDVVPEVFPLNEFVVVPVASAPVSFQCRRFGNR